MTKDQLVKNVLSHAITYSEYRRLMEKLVADNQSTAVDPNDPAMAGYTRLNDARMRRLDKSIKIPQQALDVLSRPTHKQTWLVITESWCGDAAQIIPVIHKMAQSNPGIELRLVMRDQEEELMDAFLTNGARSIPVVIVYDHQAERVIAKWGPRPSTLTKMVEEEKARHGKLSDAFKKELQVWYNRDKGQTTIADFTTFLKRIEGS